MAKARAGGWLTLLAIAAGCGASATHRGTAPVDLARGPLLWQVEGKHGPSYLFGTIHAGFDAERELAPRVWRALDRSHELVLEADVAAVDPLAVLDLARLPAGQTLAALLGPAHWQTLRGLLDQGPPGLEQLAPWLAYSLVLDRLYHTPKPLDLALEEHGRDQGMRLTYLEDWRAQLALLARTLGASDVDDLLDPGSAARRSLARLIAAYRVGDFGEIGAVVLDPEEIRADPARFRRLFDDRNRAWLDALVPRLEDGGVFVAVGVGHFAGPRGLLALLAERGVVARRLAK